MPRNDRNTKLPAEIKKVYITNKDSLEQEFRILEHSKLYEFIDDTTFTVKLKLYPLKKNQFPCGNPMIGSMLTLGQLPTRFPDTYHYKFDIIENNQITSHELDMEIHQHLWFWNIFSNKKNFNKQAGIALRGQLN